MTLQFFQAMNNCYDNYLPLIKGSGLKHLNRLLREAASPSSTNDDGEALKINIDSLYFQRSIFAIHNIKVI